MSYLGLTCDLCGEDIEDAFSMATVHINGRHRYYCRDCWSTVLMLITTAASDEDTKTFVHRNGREVSVTASLRWENGA